MIQCKPYKAKFMTDATCVGNQARLRAFNKRTIKRTPKTGEGTFAILACCPLPEYYRIRRCDGCKTWQRLYAKAAAEGRV